MKISRVKGEWLVFSTVVLAVAILAWWNLAPFSGSQRASNERSPTASLKVIATAEADFRSNDRDGNHINDFWRADVAGLYFLYPEGGTEVAAIKLIERSTALADDRPVTKLPNGATRTPHLGYWYRAIRYQGETEPDPQRFAFCAFPAEYGGVSYRYSYIITEDYVIYQKDLKRAGGIEIYPQDPLKEGWERRD